MNKINSRILIAVVVYILLTIISFSFGWWIIGLALIAGGGFILYRISGPSVGITQFDFLKKIPGNKSWWTYGLVTFSTLYFVLLGFGVLKWGWVQFNVIIMLVIIASSSILARSKDISSSLQGAMKLWTVLSIAGIIALMIATRFTPGLIQSLDYSNSSVPPPTEQSAGQQEQVAPAPVEDIIYMDPILPNTNRATNLVKTGNYTVSKGKNRLCFSRLGDEDGYHGQLIKVDGKEYNAGESGKCYPVTINQANVYVEFVYPPQSEVDTYALNRKEKNGQGVYPFLEPVQ